MSVPFLDYEFWPAGTSLASAQASRPIPKPKLSNFGVTINTASVTANTGTFYVEGTNDNPFNMDGSVKASGPVYFTIQSLLLANADVTYEPNLNQVAWAFIRFRFAPGGDTPNGTVNGKVHGQGV